MSKEISVRIDSLMHGHRIEYVLEKQLKLSSSLQKRLKREDGAVLLNGKKCRVIDKVCEGDRLCVNIKGKDSGKILPSDIRLDILMEDEDIIAVNKPAAMSVHPSHSQRTHTLANALRNHLKNSEAIHIITRLDRDTSGVVLVAKNPQMAALLSKEIKNGKIKKEYIAVVNGCPNPPCGTISAPIRKKDTEGAARCVSEDGKEAVTKYEVIKTAGGLSSMKLCPVTGRTHQLRVHMSYIGNPIYGDRMYGAVQCGERTRLHCRAITFFHPLSGEEISIRATLPDDFEGLL